MTTKDQDHLADDEFAAFLQGEGILASDLQALSHPEPSAAMSAAILGQVKSDLAQGAKSLPQTTKHAANDVRMPGASAPIRPGFMSRWRTPLALAASILCTILLLLQWQQQQSPSPVVAQGPQTAPSQVPSTVTEQNLPAVSAIVDTPQVASATKSVQSAPAAAPVKKTRVTAPAIQIAQADVLELNASALSAHANPTATRSMPKPAGKVVASPPDALTPADDVEKAKAWLTLIDEMIKADLRQDALIEWEKFHKAYPHYKVPGNLLAQIKALKK